jgi:peptidoglycan/xylan/chitin deacetylase (PgdA/CDA1 family)
VSARARAILRALVERPTLLALALASGAALLASLAAALGWPASSGARVALVLAAWSALGGLVAFAFLPGFDPRALRRVPGARVALTFDDGPHPDTTPALLAALRSANVRATFFLVGEAVERWPALTRLIAADGHAIGNHTQHHRLLVFRTAAQIADEIAACQRALAGAGVEARLFRPPHGFKPLGLHRALRRHRLTLVAWQGSIRDTDAPGAQLIVERAAALARAGRILLLHDHPRCHEQTVRALPAIVARCRALGLELVALDGGHALGADADSNIGPLPQ